MPGESAAWLADVSGGGQLETITYHSTVTGAQRSALVWTPPGSDSDRAEPYPVLYLLQDDGQSYREWAELGRVAQILDNLAVEGELEPMVVVMGDGDSAAARAEVLDNLVPAARDAFIISDDPADQAIAGHRTWRLSGAEPSPDRHRDVLESRIFLGQLARQP